METISNFIVEMPAFLIAIIAGTLVVITTLKEVPPILSSTILLVIDVGIIEFLIPHLDRKPLGGIIVFGIIVTILSIVYFYYEKKNRK